MGKKGIIALMSCVFALCLALVGCGGGSEGSNSEQAAKAAFMGTWDLVEMSQGDEVTGSDELETLKSLGLEVYVNLNEDGTSALVLFGEVIDGTWTAESATAGTITMEDQDVSMSIADFRLTFEQEGAKLTFEKGEAKETPVSDENEEEAVGDESATSDESVGEPAESEQSADEGASSESSSTASESDVSESSSSSAASESAEASSSSSSAQ